MLVRCCGGGRTGRDFTHALTLSTSLLTGSRYAVPGVASSRPPTAGWSPRQRPTHAFRTTRYNPVEGRLAMQQLRVTTFIWITAVLLALAGCSLSSGSATSTATTAPPAATTAAPAAGQATTATAATGVAPLRQPVAASTVGTPGTPTGAGSSGMATGGLPDVAAVADRVRPATVLVLNLVQGRGQGGQVPGQAGQGVGAQEV